MRRGNRKKWNSETKKNKSEQRTKVPQDATRQEHSWTSSRSLEDVCEGSHEGEGWMRIVKVVTREKDE